MKKEREMLPASCAICESPFRVEIEKKDAACKVDQTIDWARKQGLNISRFSLAKHRANHAAPKTAVALSEPPPESSPVAVKSGVAPQVPESPGANAHGSTQQAGESARQRADEKTQGKVRNITDQHFLDTVRDMVYQKLIEGAIELKVDSAFKAIEIKHKIAEESQNEKLLLEILNELRAEELRGSES